LKIFIVGISCVGKSTIGRCLSEKLGYQFFDFDTEVEKYYCKSIERLKNEHFTEYSFRQKKASRY
jgi:shikimate kinase